MRVCRRRCGRHTCAYLLLVTLVIAAIMSTILLKSEMEDMEEEKEDVMFDAYNSDINKNIKNNELLLSASTLRRKNKNGLLLRNNEKEKYYYAKSGCHEAFGVAGWREFSGANQLTRCDVLCSDYAYFGLAYGRMCSCDTVLPERHYLASASAAAAAAANECRIPCDSDPEHFCGGYYATSVYSRRDRHTDPIANDIVAVDLSESDQGDPPQPQLEDSAAAAAATAVVHVMICSEGNRLPGLMATIASVLANTKRQAVHFHLYTNAASQQRLTAWVAKAFPTLVEKQRQRQQQRHRIDVNVFDESLVAGRIRIRSARAGLANPLNYARYFLPQLFPNLGKSRKSNDDDSAAAAAAAGQEEIDYSDDHPDDSSKGSRLVYLDDDVIVRGDIGELASTPLNGHPVAFSSDCSWISRKYSLFQNRYEYFLTYKNTRIQALGIDPKTCGFNAGVFVANVAAWRKQGITAQLLTWLSLNTHEDVYGSGKGGGGSQPPMMIVFYKRHAILDPLWHVRSLGSRWGKQLPLKLVRKRAKLLHWTGRAKPWTKEANKDFVDLYQQYADTVPDPPSVVT